jgi:hypothetical protein
MSVHKNFVEWYWRNWNKLCNEKILPYQGEIFKLFSNKFHIDAKKNWERWRELLKSRWNKCWEICNEIHITLWWNEIINEELKNLVNNIVNLDYKSLSEVFYVLKNKYLETWEQWIANQIDDICANLEKMWEISKSHTTIENQK